MGDPFPAPLRKPRRCCVDIALKDILSMVLYTVTLAVTYFLSKAANDITDSANQISKANLMPFLHYETSSYSVDGLRLAIKNSGAGPAILTDFGFSLDGEAPPVLVRLPEKEPVVEPPKKAKKNGRKAKGGKQPEDARCQYTVYPRPANVLIEFEEELANGNSTSGVVGRVIGTGDRVTVIDVQLSKIATRTDRHVVFDDISNPSEGQHFEEKVVPDENHVIEWRDFCECIRAQLNNMKIWVEYQNALGDVSNRAETTMKFPSLDDELYFGLLQS